MPWDKLILRVKGQTLNNFTPKIITQSVLSRLWLHEGSIRRIWFGPYRGLRFWFSGPGFKRLGIFYRVYEKNVTDWLEGTVEPGMTVYVIGAHVGIHVLYIAKLLQGQGQIFAFEAWPENYQVLEENIRLNAQLHVKITPQKQCIASRSGDIMMAKGSSDGKHHIMRGGIDTENLIEVQSISLDDFWAQNTQCPDLILMDIEGYELEALQGAESLIKFCKPHLGLEHHDHAPELIDWLNHHHYTVRCLDNRHIFTE